MKTENKSVLTIDNKVIPIEGERNVLELARKAGIEIPTFCYHSSLSIYGACRLCLVEIEGRGIVTSCSTPPEAGMKIKTRTAEIREMRKVALELILASHDQNCPTCPKNINCKLQKLAHSFGIDRVRFKSATRGAKIDNSSPSLLRNPDKCVLCGDCVRACSEVQSVGVIDFAYRGSNTVVAPAFNKDLAEGECVNCGLCATVCPTGAITPKSEVDGVWKALHDGKKVVVAQVAPAVRVAIGEAFGMQPGAIEMGRIVSALKQMGFNYVFDTSFAADLTVIEEATEFIGRKTKGEKLPQFTSCCPAWVKFAEQFCPDFLPNLSSCKSPQQMFGSLAKQVLPKQLNVDPKNLIVVSVMPCTAKKFEAGLDKFKSDGSRDVDFVITTQELSRMIEESGLDFTSLEPQSLDMPFGFKTGAGVIFGNSGGVTEAVLRYAVEKIRGVELDAFDFQEVRGEEGLREAVLSIDGVELKLAVVNGLGNARALVEKIRKGEVSYDLVEVMACPGGCIGGAGQPVSFDHEACQKRTKGIYEADKMLQLHKSQDNPMVKECYQKHLGEVGGHTSHKLLHTHYQNRRRIVGEPLTVLEGPKGDKVVVSVCLGTNCFMRGSDALLRKLANWVQEEGLQEKVHVEATFCFENCGKAPNVMVAETLISKASFEQVCAVVMECLRKQASTVKTPA